MSVTWIDDWLGAPRFKRYVEACGGDAVRALELYEWNAQLGQALMRDIGHFEIALRNAYDVAVSHRWRGNDHWLLDPESPAVAPIWRIKKDRTGLKRGVDVNYPNRRTVDRAIHRCGGVRATPGKVIAELSLGFWSHLTSASHEKSLWVPYLHPAFPPGTNRPNVDKTISDITAVRNRIAHHEPIFDRGAVPRQEPGRLHAELMRTLTQLAPAAGDHVARTTAVPSVLSRRP